MERRMRNIKVSVIIAEASRYGCHKRSHKQKMEQIHQLHSMCIPLMRRCCMGAHTSPAGISSFHTVVTAVFTAQQRW